MVWPNRQYVVARGHLPMVLVDEFVEHILMQSERTVDGISPDHDQPPLKKSLTGQSLFTVKPDFREVLNLLEGVSGDQNIFSYEEVSCLKYQVFREPFIINYYS